MRILQSRNCLFQLCHTWSDASNHQAVAVTAKTLFQQTGQFRFSIRYDTVSSPSWLCKVCNHMSKSEQALVDLNAFFLKPYIIRLSTVQRWVKSSWGFLLYFVKLVTSQVQPLWSCEINQLKLASDLVFGVLQANTVHFNGENSMASARRSIHIVRRHNFVWGSKLK